MSSVVVSTVNRIRRSNKILLFQIIVINKPNAISLMAGLDCIVGHQTPWRYFLYPCEQFIVLNFMFSMSYSFRNVFSNTGPSFSPFLCRRPRSSTDFQLHFFLNTIFNIEKILQVFIPLNLYWLWDVFQQIANFY